MIQRGARHSKLSSNFIGSPRPYVNQWAALHRGTATTTEHHHCVRSIIYASGCCSSGDTSEQQWISPFGFSCSKPSSPKKKKQVLQGPITGVHTMTLSFATLRSLVTAATAYLSNWTSCPSCSYYRRSCAASLCDCNYARPSIYAITSGLTSRCERPWFAGQSRSRLVRQQRRGGVVPVSHGQFSLSPQTEVPSAGKR